jgi:hypothetical protein
MQRRSRALLSAATSALVAVPLIITALAPPASAATGKLLVDTFGRTGVARSSQIIAWNIGQQAQFQGNSGKSFSVPDGQYAVLAGIDDNGQAETLAEALVTVSGTGTTTVDLDARQGKQVKVTLDGKPVTDFLDARICAGPIAQVEGFQPGGALYIVPSSSHVFSSAYLAMTPGAVVAGKPTTGIPASLGGSWTSSQLAKVTLVVRSGEQIAYDTPFSLQAQGANNAVDCRSDLAATITQGQAPYRATTLVSPGTWGVRTDDLAAIGGQGFEVGGYFVNHNFAAGHSYGYTYYSAAWAPLTSLAELRPGGISYGEPLFAGPDGNGSGAAQKYSFRLSVNGHLIASKNTTDWGTSLQGYFISTRTAGWYTLTDDVSRYRPGLDFTKGTLSPRVTFAFHFFANPAVITANDFPLIAGFGIRFVPQRLSPANSAAPSSQTTVAITPFRPASFDGPSPADSVTKVQAWSSTDGSHWTALTVSHTASGYSAVVQNPASGHVYLRATVTGSHGDTSTETIYRAYAIS